MKLYEKLALIADTLDANPASVKAETELKSLDEWDSMGDYPSWRCSAQSSARRQTAKG
ncbi:hypothetical protein FACS1894167_14320 [Synergistales bacterium]|nr:hypothetical protein FACS1894167_14320 [Synergistales bacterium]GHV53972.1 hypothetical protein FACS1894216_13010 [Synergistales bacterium]